MIEFKTVRGTMGPWGHWSVGENIFHVKKDALEFATKHLHLPVYYRWYNRVWDSFNRAKLGKVSLDELYRIRAEQLRQKYSWLTLHYSGGADSHNILYTFLKNKIKLDHIYINWPKKTVNNSAVYTANSVDQSAKNILSEWELCIVPTLKYLAQHHPEIQIEIGDWSENLTENHFKDESFIAASGFWGAGSLFRNLNESKVSKDKIDKGINAADMFGFDKPHLFLHPDNITVSMFFHDAAFQTSTNAVGAFEPFYWSPDLPELAYEMAYSNFQFYNAHPAERHYIRSGPMRVTKEICNEYNNTLSRKLCYSTSWDMNKFQAGKPYDGKRMDRDFWIYENKEFDRLVDVWQHNYQGFLSNISKTFFDHTGAVNPIRSKLFYLGTFDSPSTSTQVL